MRGRMSSHCARRVHAEDAHDALLGVEQAEDVIEHCRLARPVRAQERDALAVAGDEVEAAQVDRRPAVVAVADARDQNDLVLLGFPVRAWVVGIAHLRPDATVVGFGAHADLRFTRTVAASAQSAGSGTSQL